MSKSDHIKCIITCTSSLQTWELDSPFNREDVDSEDQFTEELELFRTLIKSIYVDFTRSYPEHVSVIFDFESSDFEVKSESFDCPICHGTKVMQGSMMRGQKCFGCDGTGHMVGYMKNQLSYAETQYNVKSKDFDKLVDFVMRTSKCEKCHGDSYKTPGGCPCEECGLEGTQPWGG